MPIVPGPQLPSVAPERLPGVRVSVGAPLEAFGGGRAAEGLDLAPLESIAQELAAREKQKADQIAVSDAGAKLTALKTNLMWHPQSGAMLAQGKQAFGVYDQTMEAWRKGVSETGQGLRNDAQRMSFRHMVDSHTADLTEQLTHHVATQQRVYDGQVTEAHIDALTNDALANYRDPNAVDRNLDTIKAVATDYALRNGHATQTSDGRLILDDFAKDQLAKHVSSVRSGVIEQLADTKQDLAAAKYLADHRSDFVGSDLLRAEKIVDTGSVEGASQRESDRIMQSATTEGAALAEAAKIQDPRVRDATEKRVRQAFADRSRDLREQRENALHQATEIINRTGDYTQVPMATRNLLTPTEIEDVQTLARNVRNPKRVTNQAFYANLINMAGLNDSTRQHFMGLNLMSKEYRDQLDDQHYDYLLNLQREMRTLTERREVTATGKVHHEEEQAVIKQSEEQRKAAALRAKTLAANPQLEQYLPKAPRSKIQVPRWMLDSARVDTDYRQYLELHGVNIGNAVAAPAGGTRKPTTPGSPIDHYLTPAPNP